MVASFWEELTPGGIEDDTEVVTYRYDEIYVLGRDKREHEARLQVQQEKGLISVDEYRDESGRDVLDLPGSRVLWLAAGKAPVGTDEDVQAILTQGQPEPTEPPPEGEGPPEGEPPPEGELSDDPIGDALLLEGKSINGRADPFARHRLVQGAVTHQWEKAVADELNALMHRQQKVVLARLGGPKGRKHTRHWVTETPLPAHELKALNGKYIVDRNRWIDEVVAAITDIVQAAFAAAGKFIASQLGDGEFTDDDDPAKEVIAQTVRIIAEGFDARTGRLQELIEAGDAAGKNIEDITADVREAYTQAETWTDVTSRQVVGAMNAAQNIAATDAGALKKRWLATDDERTRPTHREAEGQVVGIDEKFDVGDGELLFPGDVTGPVGEWINCRCTMLFQTKARDFDAELDEDLADLDAYEAALEGKAVLDPRTRRRRRVPSPQRPVRPPRPPPRLPGPVH